MIRRTLILLGIIWIAITFATAQPQGKEPANTMYYELYSWQEPSGSWNFSLLRNTSSEKTVRQVFAIRNRVTGVDQLKKKISELPRGATIIGVGRLPTGTGPKAKGSEALTYPPQEIVKDLQRYAEPRKIKIEVSPPGK